MPPQQMNSQEMQMAEDFATENDLPIFKTENFTEVLHGPSHLPRPVSLPQSRREKYFTNW